MDSLKLKNLALFAGGVLFGTAGVKILSSEKSICGRNSSSSSSKRLCDEDR